MKVKIKHLLYLSILIFILTTYIILKNVVKFDNHFFIKNADILIPVKRFAFFFPQFYEFEENNKFWGRGFTDFTNIIKLNLDPTGNRILKPESIPNVLDGSYLNYLSDLLKKSNIDFIVIYFYWFNYQVMFESLNNIAYNSNIKFVICWVNENWTKRWDGGSNDILLDLDYKSFNHNNFQGKISNYFKLNNYYKVDGRPIFLVYDSHNLPDQFLTKMKSNLQFISGEVVSSVDMKLNYDFDLHVIFQPRYSKYFDEELKLDCIGPNVIFGTYLNWNNYPRHINSPTWSIDIANSLYSYSRRLKKLKILEHKCPTTILGHISSIQSVNEWGEGNSLELPREVNFINQLSRNYIQYAPKDNLVIVRYYHKHCEMELNRILLNISKWQVKIILVNTDIISCDLTNLSQYFYKNYMSDKKYNLYGDAGYEIIDEVLRIESQFFDRMLITNADNEYFDNPFLCDMTTDISLMPFYSRWNVFNNKENSFNVFNVWYKNYTLILRQPEVVPGGVDLGSIIFSTRLIHMGKLQFNKFSDKCQTCQDFAFVLSAIQQGYSWSVNHCAHLIHSPTPDQCINNDRYWVWSSWLSDTDCYDKRKLSSYFESKLFKRPSLFIDDIIENKDGVFKTNKLYSNLVENWDKRDHFNCDFYYFKNLDIDIRDCDFLFNHWRTQGVKEGRISFFNFKNDKIKKVVSLESLNENIVDLKVNELIVRQENLPNYFCVGSNEPKGDILMKDSTIICINPIISLCGYLSFNYYRNIRKIVIATV